MEDSDDVKVCMTCKRTLHVSGFPRYEPNPDGLSIWCYDCVRRYVASKKSGEIESPARPRKLKLSPEERERRKQLAKRAQHLRESFFMEPEEYERMLSEQGGVCAICGCLDPMGKELAVDHHHSTGLIRGLLCYRCNLGISHFNESPERLVRASEYLRAWGRIHPLNMPSE